MATDFVNNVKLSRLPILQEINKKIQQLKPKSYPRGILHRIDQKLHEITIDFHPELSSANFAQV